MHRTFVNVNEHSFSFFNYKEALTYVMNLAMSHHKFSPLDILKENICEACDLVSEYLTMISDDELDKSTRTSLKRLATKILKVKEFLRKAKNKNSLLFQWSELLLSVEGKGLLHGFGFGDKKFHDVIKGNPERTSVTRTIR